MFKKIMNFSYNLFIVIVMIAFIRILINRYLFDFEVIDFLLMAFIAYMIFLIFEED